MRENATVVGKVISASLLERQKSQHSTSRVLHTTLSHRAAPNLTKNVALIIQTCPCFDETAGESSTKKNTYGFDRLVHDRNARKVRGDVRLREGEQRATQEKTGMMEPAGLRLQEGQHGRRCKGAPGGSTSVRHATPNTGILWRDHHAKKPGHQMPWVPPHPRSRSTSSGISNAVNGTNQQRSPTSYWYPPLPSPAISLSPH